MRVIADAAERRVHPLRDGRSDAVGADHERRVELDRRSVGGDGVHAGDSAVAHAQVGDRRAAVHVDTGFDRGVEEPSAEKLATGA